MQHPQPFAVLAEKVGVLAVLLDQQIFLQGVDLLVLGGRLRAALAQVDWPTAAVLGPVTCSFGMAVFPHHGSTAQALFMAADSALYRAKAKGRDRVEAAVAAALSDPA